MRDGTMPAVAISSTTTRERFRDLAARHRVVPVTRTVLADAETPLSTYRKLAADRPGTFLLESAEPGRSWSRWSFIGAGSDSALTVRDGQATWLGSVPEAAPRGGDIWAAIRATIQLLQTLPNPDLPPLTSGLVGYLGYDSVRYIERLPTLARDDLRLPDAVLLLATDIAAYDHHKGAITLIANAVNWDGTDIRVEEAYDDAVARLDRMSAALAVAADSTVSRFEEPDPDFHRRTTAAEFGEKVRRVVSEIEAGEAFQVVVSQRFEMDFAGRALDVYRMLRTSNPSPYMYLMHIPDEHGNTAFSIVGSSPEALVTVQDRTVTSHPIAGTRWRGDSPAQDAQLAQGLLEDEKENAEHVMLVDLARNDVGRVCSPGTVTVRTFRQIERYSHVMHLVSTVTGELAAGRVALDAVRACFPAGTLSGAPKVRAMELIEELEPTRRGVYGGVVGYLDFAGNADTAIAIRTAVLRDGVAFVQAGGGVVADSRAEYEDNESCSKAMAVLRAVAAAATVRVCDSGQLNTAETKGRV